MALKYIGYTGFILAKLPEWKVDSWGVDHCTIVERGPTNVVDQQMNLVSAWQTMGRTYYPQYNIDWPAYPMMWLTGMNSAEFNAAYSDITFEFAGFRSGKVPLDRYENDISIQTAQSSIEYTPEGEDTPISVSLRLSYRSPRTQWNWFMLTNPPSQAPPSRYQALVSEDGEIYGNPLRNTMSYSLTGSTDAAAFDQALNAIAVGQTWTDYKRTLVIPDITAQRVGLLWACSSTVDIRQTN